MPSGIAQVHPVTGLADFALRVACRTGSTDWFVLVVRNIPLDNVAQDLASELEIVSSLTVTKKKVSANVRDFLEEIKAAEQDVVLAHGFETYSADTWKNLDLVRSRLGQSRRVVLLLRPDSADLLVRTAPNISSWMGRSVWRLREPDSLANRKFRSIAGRETKNPRHNHRSKGK